MQSFGSFASTHTHTRAHTQVDVYELLPEDNHASDALWRADEVALIRDALESRVPPLHWWAWLAGKHCAHTLCQMGSINMHSFSLTNTDSFETNTGDIISVFPLQKTWKTVLLNSSFLCFIRFLSPPSFMCFDAAFSSCAPSLAAYEPQVCFSSMQMYM